MLKKCSKFLSKYGVEMVFLCMIIIATIIAPKFASISNIMSVLRQISITAPIAFGMTFIIINGNIDISVGGIVGLSSMVAIWCNINGMPIIVSILAALLIGTVVGVINAYNVYTGLAPYIVTMCTNLILRGLCNLMTNGQPVYGITDNYKIFGQGFVGPIAIPIIIAAIVYAVLWFVLHHTTVGRSTYAVGGNREAARLSGINVLKSKIFVFVLSGVCAAITGIVLGSRLGSSDPTIGVDYQVDAIAATVIGGTSMSGGEGRLQKTLIGVLIVGVLSNVLNLARVSAYFQDVAKGIIIFAAVIFDNSRRRKRV